ncbi:hypothetical protein ACFY94_41135 [Streptomyces griseorubiginosus]|uniref:hypothetical protein n=1 Tax=Streptomyces griseorubiginosus TaxID=67304 RepID=UPI0036E364F3
MVLLVPLLMLVLAGAACALLGYGGGRIADWFVRRAELPAALLGFAALAGAATAALYAWGLLHVGGAVLEAEDGGADSSPILPCRDDERAAHVVDYSVSFLPPDFVCETDDGGYRAGEVPGYVTPAALGLALAAAGLAVASGYVSEVRLRAAARAGGGVRP